MKIVMQSIDFPGHSTAFKLVCQVSQLKTLTGRLIVFASANCHVERFKDVQQDGNLSSSQNQVHNEHSSDFAQQYKKMESLCGALKQDLERDIALEKTNVLPEKFQLASVTASVYCQVRFANNLEAHKESDASYSNAIEVF